MTAVPFVRLSLRLAPSWTLAALLAGAHLLALGCVLLAGLPAALSAAATAAIVASFLFLLLRDALLRLPVSVLAVEAYADGRFAMVLGSGEWVASELHAGSFVASGVAVLRLRPTGGGRGRCVTVLSDAVAAEPFRRLRVRLRWQSAVATATLR